MKPSEMREMSCEDLLKKIVEWQKELLLLRVQGDLNKKVDHPHKFSFLRKDIARAKTIVGEKRSGK